MSGLGAILGGGIGAIGGAAFGSPWVGAGIGSSLGNALEGTDPTVQTTTQSRSTTPYQVRLADGTVITLYAHGPTSEQTVTEEGDMTGDAIADALLAFGMMKEKGAETVGKSVSSAPTAKLMSDPGAFSLGGKTGDATSALSLGNSSSSKLMSDPGAFSLGESGWMDDFLKNMGLGS